MNKDGHEHKLTSDLLNEWAIKDNDRYCEVHGCPTKWTVRLYHNYERMGICEEGLDLDKTIKIAIDKWKERYKD